MARLLSRPITDRHVVFPDSQTGWHPVVNYAPASQPPAPVENLTTSEEDGARWLFEQAGLSLDDYRPETIKRRMHACLRLLRIDSPVSIQAALRREPHLLKPAISMLVIGVTSFFRDAPVFATLAESILPELLSRQQTPRIWSIGCSDGAELYSVGILLAERGAIQRSTLLGTDCRADAIAAAREGRYDPAAVRGVPQSFLGRYLTFDGNGWHVHPYLRATVQWRSGNALATREPGTWDMILCRNMAIYMQPTAASRLWASLEQCVRPGGFLVLGKAERPLGGKSLGAVAPCIYRRYRSGTC